MNQFLEPSTYIDHTHPAVAAKARELAEGLEAKEAIAKRCFEYVRDKIAHTGDAGKGASTVKASVVLEKMIGHFPDIKL